MVEVLKQLRDIHDGTRKPLPQLVLFHPVVCEEVVEVLVSVVLRAFYHR